MDNNIITAIFPDDEFKIYDGEFLKERILVVGQVQSGKTRFMIEQSINALKDDFDLVIILGGTNNNLLSQTKKRFNKEFSGTDNILINAQDSIYKSIPKNKTLITALKGKDSLGKVMNLLRSTTPRKTLLFDDESDFGGINIDSKGEGSKIFKQLNEIYSYINEIKFVSVTATPFADILAKESNAISRTHVITPPEEYTGSEFFMNNNIYESFEVNNRNISNANLIYVITDHINRLSNFLLAGNKFNTQMLINNSMENIGHIQMQRKVIAIVENMRIDPEIYGFTNISIAEEILEEISKNIEVLNSTNNQLDLDKGHMIVIGGALVSRGFTFENLLTTLLTNEPSAENSADTLLQRARWFGYRKENNLYKYMKVFASQKTINGMKECDKLISEVHKKLQNKENMNSIKKHILEIGNDFKYIKPTGKNQ